MIFAINPPPTPPQDPETMLLPVCEQQTILHGREATPHSLLPLLEDTSPERLALAASLNAIATAVSLEDVKAQTRLALSRFLPCEHFIFTRGWLKADRLMVSHLDYANSVTNDYLDGIVGESDQEAPPLNLELIRNCGRPKFMTMERLEKSVDPARAQLMRRHGIRNIAWIVLPGLQRNTFTGYFFQNVAPGISGDVKLRLTILAPYVHIALSRVSDLRPLPMQQAAGTKSNSSLALLSSREIEISRWIAQGKTNWEIGRILGISDKTVKTHIQNILFKLRVSNRAQVAALFSSE